MQPSLELPPSTSDQVDPAQSPLQWAARFYQLLLRRKRIVLIALAATWAIGLAYFTLAPRYYQSVAKLMIIQQSPDQVSTVSEQAGAEGVMASQRELVRSAKVVLAAIEGLRPEHRIDLIDQPVKEWIDSIKKRLSASSVRDTNHMAVSYRSRDPETAAAVVDSVINAYVDFVRRTHRGAAANVVADHQRRLDKIEAELAEKQLRLQQLRSSVEALSATGKEGVVDPVVSEAIHLHETLMSVRQQRIQLQASMATIEQALRDGHDVRRYLSVIQRTVGEQVLLASLGLTAQDTNIQTDRHKQLLAAEDELRRITPYLGTNHPRTVALAGRIEATRQYLASYRSTTGDRLQSMTNAELGPLLRETLRQSLTQALSQERQIEESYRSAFAEATRKSSAIDELAQLQRNVEQLEEDRHAYHNKIQELDDHQLLAPIHATIVQDPLPDDEPVSPQLSMIVVGATLSGLLIGALIVCVQDMLDDRFGSPEEMAAQLGAPVLSLVKQLQPTGGEGVDAIHMHTGEDQTETEAFRTLRTALTLGGEVADRLVVSSAEPSDGKTTISSNLAVAFAQVGKRTLVIDADLRKPGLTALLQLKGKPGVTDLLITDRSIAEVAAEVVRPSGVERLDVISAGPRRPDAAELLAGSNFKDLLAWADANYDQVLIDCPPVLAVSDAQIVGRLVDGVILVVSPEKNHRHLVGRACSSFQSAGVHLFGVVANRISEQSSGYGYGYGYSYGEEEESVAMPLDAPAETPGDMLAASWDELTAGRDRAA